MSKYRYVIRHKRHASYYAGRSALGPRFTTKRGAAEPFETKWEAEDVMLTHGYAFVDYHAIPIPCATARKPLKKVAKGSKALQGVKQLGYDTHRIRFRLDFVFAADGEVFQFPSPGEITLIMSHLAPVIANILKASGGIERGWHYNISRARTLKKTGGSKR